MKRVQITNREAGDLIMLGIGGFTPLKGFMGYDDWNGVVSEMKMTDGTFEPIPITRSGSEEDAASINEGDEIALYTDESDEIRATMKVEEKYSIDKRLECREVYKTDDENHPGVKLVLEQKEVNLGGSVRVLSEGEFPEKFAGKYHKPDESRKRFSDNGWKLIACLRLRNPIHRSH